MASSGGVEPGSELDLAIQQAMNQANLRAGDAVGETSAWVAEQPDPSSAEAGDTLGGGDAD